MGIVGCLLFLTRALARVLDRQGCGDDYRFEQAAFLVAGQHNASEPRIDREPSD